MEIFLTDDDLVQQAMDEMQQLPAGGVGIVLQPSSALALAAVLQLALRHLDLRGEPDRVAVQALDHLRTYFAACPAVRQLLRLGDDPACDDEAPRSTTEP